MATSITPQGPMDAYLRKQSQPPPAYGSAAFMSDGAINPSVRPSGYTSSLWETAVGNIRQKLPSDIDSSNPAAILQQVVTEADERKEESKTKEHKVKLPGKSGKEIKLRDIYGSILSCAKRFRDVGDIAIQASPPQAALPWAIVRLCLTAAFNEHEFYGVMMQGLEMVSSIVTHYIVIERLFVGEVSDHAQAVRNSLLALYAAVLDFLVEALKYFPSLRKEEDKTIKHYFRKGADKAKRTFMSSDVSSQAEVKRLLNQVSKSKDDVDSDSNHAYASMNLQAINRSDKFQDIISKQLDALGVAQNDKDRRLDALLTEFEKPLESIENKVAEMYESMEQSREEAHVREVLDWLSPVALDNKRRAYHQSLRNTTLPSSGTWLLQDPIFVRWHRSAKSSVAWLRGISGTGKTSLMSIVVNYLQSRSTNAERLAFFYISPAEDFGAKTDPDEILRNLTRQLSHIAGSSELEVAIKQRFEQVASATDQPLKPTKDECINMILDLSISYPIYIVIDGLDDPMDGDSNNQIRSSMNDFIQALRQVLLRSSSPVKLFFSTLSDSSAEKRLRTSFGKPYENEEDLLHELYVMEVNADSNHKDIEYFIDDQVKRRIKSNDLLEGKVDESLKTKISQRLLQRSNGNFSFVSVLMDRICDESMSKTMVLEEIENSPGISDIYERSVNEIRNSSKPRTQATAKAALRWLLCLQDTLYIPAFLEAVNIEGGIDELTPNNLHSACRLLIKKAQIKPDDDRSEYFEFTDPFVKEYLNNHPEFTATDCHLTAADRCLKMMIRASFTSARPKDGGRISFHWYAKRFWAYHYQNIDFSIKSEDKALEQARLKNFAQVRESLRKFVIQGKKTSQAFTRWLKEIPDLVTGLEKQDNLSHQMRSLQASADIPLHAICVFGFADLIGAHHKDFRLDQRNAYGQTALSLAIENNHPETAKSLLTADPGLANEFNVEAVRQLIDQVFEPAICYASPLQAAAVLGSVDMVEMLIESGAKTDLVAGYYGNILQAACLQGHTELVQYLLEERDMDPNTQGGFHGNSLQAASASGHVEIVDALIDRGACALTPGGHYGSAVIAAARASSQEVVNRILSVLDEDEIIGVVNQRSAEYGTPLEQAACQNNIELVDLLIGNHADIKALGSSESVNAQKDSSALAVAAWGVHKRIVSILCNIDAEADLSYSDGDFHLLHQAAQHNMMDLAELCLERECNINMTTTGGIKYHPDQRKMTPLAIACAEGHVQLVELFLTRGARIQYPGDNLPLLCLVASRGHTEVVRLIIEEHKSRHSNDPKSTQDLFDRRIPGSEDAAIHVSARVGAREVAATLLQHGASWLTTKMKVGLLQNATWEGRPGVVNVLLEHLKQSPKLDLLKEINAQDVNGKSALIDAAQRGRGNIFSKLLDHGADYKVKENKGNSVLHFLVWGNHHEMTKSLLAVWEKEDPAAKQAWLDHQNSSGITGLQDALIRRHHQVVRILLDAGARVTPCGARNFIWRIRVKKETKIEEVQEAIAAFGDHKEELTKYLNIQNGDNGFSLLHEAACENRIDVVQLALDHGADVTTTEVYSSKKPDSLHFSTPLHHVVCRNYPDIVNLLLSHASQHCDKGTLSRFVNFRNDLGKTALIDGAERNRVDFVKLLLSKPYSADWSIIDNNQQNALHWCVWRHHMPTIEILLKQASGADGEDLMASSPIGQKRFAAFLNQQNTPGSSPLFDATWQNHEDIARMLLYNYHAEYEIYDQHGDSILHRAVQRDHDQLLKPYLEYMSKDKDQGKFRRVLHHKNKSMNRTVLEALEARGRKGWADYVRGFGS
ncbi:hypothetical protein ACLMJK_009525 [Lecanora helva]